jgi:hypothetical protein
MKKVLLLVPRLDVLFIPNSYIPSIIGPPLDNGKKLWGDFLKCLEKEYKTRSDIKFSKLELPIWQFSPNMLKDYDYDMVLVPHSADYNFKVKNKQVYYYMQTTFPWIFSVDPKGWAGGASVYPYNSLYTDKIDSTVFNNLRTRALENKSKFDQPKYTDISLPENFVLFTCQIPTDQNVMYHSKTSVINALIWTCKATEKINIPLIVKGHLYRKETMNHLKQIVKTYKHAIFMEDVSIHQLISLSKCVVTINSGTGMEALLHKKPVITFGKAEYDCVTNHATKDNIIEVLKNLSYNENDVIRFFDTWYNWCYDVNNPDSFFKLP